MAWIVSIHVSLFAAVARADDRLRYNRDVRPILAENCFRCHGPGVRKADLRLDVADSARGKAKSGEVPFVPGKPDESELIRRILSDDANDVMPPPSAKKTLSQAQKDLLKRWVAEGAAYEKHWSFESPAKVAPPRVEGGVAGDSCRFCRSCRLW